MITEGKYVTKFTYWLNSLATLKNIIITLFITVFLIYVILKSTDSESSIEAIDFSYLSETSAEHLHSPVSTMPNAQKNNPQNTSHQKLTTALPVPAKKLTKLLAQPTNISQINNESSLDVDQKITEAKITIDNLDQQLTALGYQPEIVNYLDDVDAPNSTFTERFENIKKAIQQ